ncbi:MAG: hypothetical protein R2755_20700 [Acidimicrobiales bacterium]
MSEPVADSRFVEVLDADGRTRWRVDRGFLGSNWRCIWGEGCQGIEDEAAPQLHRGCCSVGARLADEQEAMTVAALAACLLPEQFEHYVVAATKGIFADDTRRNTAVVDGACVFLNRPGFAGGMGCALHLAAEDDGCDPADYKPGVCSRLPLRAETLPAGPDGEARFELRAWRRDDWGPGGATMAWWCTEAPECFTGDEAVIDSMAEPLRRLVGDETAERVRRALGR